MSRRLIPFMVLGLALAACEDEQPSPVAPIAAEFSALSGEQRPSQAFEVYTQNVYLGGDTGPLFTIDFSNIPAVVAATNVFWQQVGQSAAPERMAAIVDEIEARRPHVVGLQEVLRFVVLSGTGAVIGGLDLLALIEAEISARGLPYTTEIVQPATSATLPLAVSSTGVTQALNFTDRLVVLRRNDVPLTAEESGLYAAVAPLGPVTLKRGWARVSVDHHGTPHNFITTHLEVQALAPVQAGQTQQLLQVVASLDGVTILAGDLNSDAAAQPGDPSWTNTYDLVRAAGFADVWDLAPPASRGRGFTCCQAIDLRNRVSQLDERIDFVLVRSDQDLGRARGKSRGHYRIEVVGDERSDRTASGLWPADHGGLVASIRSTPHR